MKLAQAKPQCAQNTSLSAHPPQWTKCREITKPMESLAITGRFNISDSLWEYIGSPQLTTIYLMAIQNDKNWTYDWSSQSQPIAACLQSNDQHSGLANWHEFIFAASQGHVNHHLQPSQKGSQQSKVYWRKLELLTDLLNNQGKKGRIRHDSLNDITSLSDGRSGFNRSCKLNPTCRCWWVITISIFYL